MTELKHLKSDGFDDFVSEGASVIDFYADWCGPCKIMAPRFEEVAKEMKGKVNFAKVDVDNDDSREISERFEILSIPTLLFIKDGEVVNRITGALSKEDLIDAIEQTF